MPRYPHSGRTSFNRPPTLHSDPDAAYPTLFPVGAGYSSTSPLDPYYYFPSSFGSIYSSSSSRYGSQPFYGEPAYTSTTVPVQPSIPRDPNANHAGGHCSRITTGAGAIAAGQRQGGPVAPPPTVPEQPSASSSAIGCNTSGGRRGRGGGRRGRGGGGDGGQPATGTSSATARGMGGGRMQPGYHYIVKAFDQRHQCDENCPRSDGSDMSGESTYVAATDYAAAKGDDVGEYYGPDLSKPDCVGDGAGPYLEYSPHYDYGMSTVEVAAAEKGGENSSGKSTIVQDLEPKASESKPLANAKMQSLDAAAISEGQTSLVLQAETSKSTTLTSAEPKSSEEAAPCEGGDPVFEVGSNQGLRTMVSMAVSTASTGSETESLVEEDESLGEFGQCVVISRTTTARRMPNSLMESGPKISLTLAATAENKEASVDPSVGMPKDPPQEQRFCDELEGFLEEEARQQREARELRKKNKKTTKRSTSTTPGARDDDYAKGIDYALAKQLIGYETLGYLNKIEAEEEDESLLHYGDSFGLAVLSEYPNFFMNVPQRPHYKKASPEEVDAAEAERLWDLFMPLVRRGLRAAREGNAGDIAAVEQVVAGLEGCGFDLRHLKAYMGTARRLRAALLSAGEALGKVGAGIEREDERIRAIISSKPLRESIKELEMEKAGYQDLVKRIEELLAEKMALLGEEESVRETRSTPAMEELLRSKDFLNQRLQGVLKDLESLGLS